ncbi:MAG: flagellar hook-associated protein FlgK [Fuerstiella sp.]
MRAFDIGLSAIRTHTTTLNAIGNNIANASTPGYHRQRVDLVTRLPALNTTDQTGAGVEVGGVRRMIDFATEDAILRNASLQGLNTAELETARDIETLLHPGTAGVHEALSGFFNNLEAVANSPEIRTVRSEMLSGARNLLERFESIHDGLIVNQKSRISELQDAVSEINSSIEEIAELNRSIQLARARGQNPNSLLDRRDAVVERLSNLTDASIVRQTGDREVVMVGSVLAISEAPQRLQLAATDDGWELQLESGGQRVPISTGQVGGLLESINETIPSAIDRLQEAAATVVRSVDQQHAQGLTENGAYSVLQATRSANSVTAPLNSAGLPFDIGVGELTLTITDAATGDRTSHRIAVDPFSDSLTDIASRISAISGATAFVNSDTGRLSISGDGNRLVDFAGRVDNVPDLSSFSGTGVPRFSGQFTGTANDNWTVSFNTNGTIGVTDGLTATITNGSGQVLTTLDVGAGYEAGTPLSIADGVAVEFAVGTVQAVDTASVMMTVDPDTSGLLSAVGLNSLFTGGEISSFAIRDDLIAEPSGLAISGGGNVGDAANARRLSELRDLRFAVLDDRTFIEELADFTADAGLRAAQASSDQQQLESHASRLFAERESISGVSTEEEFLHMLEVERAFQAAARFITTVDETVNEIMNLIR